MNTDQFIDSLKTIQANVYMLCGIAGAGKTTLANKLVELGFVRLSIDEYIWKNFGKYGIDFSPGEYPKLQQIA